MKKLLTGILLAAIILQASGCGAEKVPSGDGETTLTDAPETTTDAGTSLKAPDFPGVKMDGKEFNILTQGWCAWAPLDIVDVGVTEQNGEILNDKAYERKSAIEEKYDCVINEIYDANGGNDAVTMINAAVMSGDNLYDIAVIRSLRFNSLITAGNLTDLATVPNLELESGYYVKQSYDALSIEGTHYGIVSGITTNANLLTFCAYFNKVMLDSYKLDNVYDLVRSGKWTLDKMQEMGKAVAADVNNDGKYDSKDRYGVVHVIDAVEGFVSASGVKLAEVKNGKIEKTYKSESSVEKMQRIFDILSDKQTIFNVHARGGTAQEINKLETGMFIEGQTLFTVAGLFYAPLFRDMKDDFGIVPMPKYDEAQEDYISPVFANLFPITVIPRSNDDLDSTGILLEELSYRGQTELVPALYDTILSGKCARDDDSVEMLNMIFEKPSYDIGMIFDFGGVRTEVRNILHNLEGNFASTFASIDSKVDANIDALIKAVDENK